MSTEHHGAQGADETTEGLTVGTTKSEPRAPKRATKKTTTKPRPRLKAKAASVEIEATVTETAPAPPMRTAIKVLRSGASWHGGTHAWSLPTQNADGSWEPGAWTPPVPPRLCSTGYHLTNDPVAWWADAPDVIAYLAEYDGRVDDRGEDKFSVERCRLLRPLNETELAAVGIYLTGEHDEVTNARLVGGAAHIKHLADCKVRRMTGSARIDRVDGEATAHASGDAVIVVRYSRPIVTVRGRASVLDYRPARPVHHVADDGQVLTLATDGTATQAPAEVSRG